MSESRFQPFLAVYLIFKNSKNQVLLHKRVNTGYEDGKYGLVSGHVDAGENFITAAVREGKEEAGVEIDPNDLTLAYIEHYTGGDRVYIIIYFTVENYQGEIQNMEPNKCDDLSWFDLNSLPNNIIENIKFALEAVKEGRNFGEYGWK